MNRLIIIVLIAELSLVLGSAILGAIWEVRVCVWKREIPPQPISTLFVCQVVYEKG